MAETKKKNSTSKQTSSAKPKAKPEEKEKKEVLSKRDTSQLIGSRVKDEIWAILIIAIGAFLVISMHTQAAGKVGEIVSSLLKGVFGVIGFVLPYYLIVYGILLLINKMAHITGRSAFFLGLTFLMLTLFNSYRFLGPEAEFSLGILKDAYGLGTASGGSFGMFIGSILVQAFGKVTGLLIIPGVVTLISLLLVFNTPISKFLDDFKLKRAEKRALRAIRREEAAAEEAAREAEMAKAGTGLDVKPAIDRPMVDIKPEAPAAEAAPVEEKPEEPPVQEVQAQVPETGYVPGSMSEGQKNIMSYVKDPELFSGATPREGFGLEEPYDGGMGKGLSGRVTEEEIQAASLAAAGVAVASTEAKAEETSEIEPAKHSYKKKYKLPPVSLLTEKSGGSKSISASDIREKAQKLEDTLQSFKVDAHVVDVTPGPTVTRYEVQPAAGVKVNSIVNLANDIALAMEAKSIRIEAPIPGKAAVGIEIENEKVDMVTIREVIASPEFKNHKSKISFAVGKDIAGNPVVGDLKGMPHLLIAGSTGSGKSVCINSIITSFLYKARPEELKLILIDPKVVELGNYNGIPHLLIPVVTEPVKAAAALNWAVAEMGERYRKFADDGVRELESYNEAAIANEEPEKVLPQLVIIIDELADLMMAARNQVEDSISRLAALGRACGIHLIVATQRPSVDVITGVIKNNIPSRIAFSVGSQFDSRTIIDMNGAENLVGKGDMLYSPQGLNKPIRVQGNFISDAEIHRVIDYVKEQASEEESAYKAEVMESMERVANAGSEPADETDELLPEAIELVVKSGQASVSMLQRRFRIGYNRAARMVDMMEARGVVGPADGSRPRQVLISEVDFYAMKEELQEEQQS